MARKFRVRTFGRWLVGLACRSGMAMAALIVVLGLVAQARASELEPHNGYRFGVFPYLPTLTLDRIFGPMAWSFGQDLGRPIHLRTKPTFAKFADEMAKQSYDVIFVHPFFYVEAADKYHYLPIARLAGPLTAVIMVAESNPARSLQDLTGKILALPPELAAISELTRATLAAAGLHPGSDVELRHFRTKVSCLQAVATGSAEACAVPEFVLSQIGAAHRFKLRPLAHTAAISSFVFAVHERVPEKDRLALLRCALSWPNTEQGRKILAAGSWPGFVAAHDSDYDDVRRFNAHLDMLVQR